jgi:hypothetical protein
MRPGNFLFLSIKTINLRSGIMEVKNSTSKIIPARSSTVLQALSFIGVIGSITVLIPGVRSFIISFICSFVENAVVRRNVNQDYLNKVIFSMSYTGVFVFAGLFAVVRWFSFIKRFLTEHYNGARYLLAVPVIFAFLIVTFFGVNIPIWDEWELLLFLNGVREHGIRFGDFFVPHGIHRMFFPRIAFLASALLTNFNVKANMYISWGLITAMYGVYIVYLRKTIKCESQSDKLKRLFLCLIVGFCCFNLVQIENILFGFQVAFFMIGAFSVSSFYFFYRYYTEKKSLYLILSVASGFIAAFSSFHGVLVFPVILLLLLLLRISGEKTPVKCVFTIIIVTILTYIIYFYNLQSQSDQLRYLLKHFFQAAIYFFTAVGSPFTFLLPIPAFIFGLLLFFAGISLTVYLILEKKIRNYIFPLCLLYFGYAFCAAIAIGRSHAGIWQSLSSRYTTFSLFVFIGLLIIVYTESAGGKKHILLNYFASGIRFLLVVLLFLQYIYFGGSIYTAGSTKGRISSLRNYQNESMDTLRQNYPLWRDIDSAREYIGILEKNRWSVFSQER